MYLLTIFLYTSLFELFEFDNAIIIFIMSYVEYRLLRCSAISDNIDLLIFMSIMFTPYSLKVISMFFHFQINHQNQPYQKTF